MKDIKSINSLFIHYDVERDKFLDSLEKNTEKSLRQFVLGEIYMEYDKSCMINMGNIQNTKTKDFSCDSCSILSKIIDLDSNAENKEFVVSSGSHKNKKIKILSYPIPDFSYTKFYNKYYNLDSFSSKLITTIMINKIQEEKNFSVCPKIYNSFTCRKNTYMLYESSNVKNINETLENYDNIKSLLFQFLSFIDTMKEYNYSHGSSVFEKFGINRQENKSRKSYKNYNLVSDISIKFYPSKLSSLNLKNGDRIFCDEHKMNIKNLLLKDLYYSSEKNKFFILSEFVKLNEFQGAKCLGLYNNIDSLDSYFFIISLFSYLKFNNILNKNLLKIWNILWDNEIPIPTRYLKEEKEVYNYIKGKKIFTDIQTKIFKEVFQN